MKEKNESPFKKVHKMIQELIGEVNSKLKVNTWDGKPFTSPKAGELRATKDFINSPNYFEFIPSGKPSTRDNTLYLNLSQERFDAIVAGHKKIEYREVNQESMGKYVDVRESSDGLIIVLPIFRQRASVFFFHCYKRTHFLSLYIVIGYFYAATTIPYSMAGSSLVILWWGRS
ncbi:hypothetical protein [Porphyromonas levii]|uniref:hypothetical protein n=1 Tax=Porphyromonas levii TaxID=28114 RepID=UPI001B8C97A8|nr:hypothetical protein [Porphyromonas levii]MBR8770172.1 hypothetical protein [Porphyromonas levii]